MTYKNIIGIDPGASGGIATYNSGVWGVVGMDLNSYMNVKNYLKSLTKTGEGWICFLEQISLQVPRRNILYMSKPQIQQYMNETFGMIQRIQKLVKGYVGIEIALKECGIDYAPVMPRVWQGRLGLISKEKETTTEKKNRHKEAADATYEFANIKSIHKTADALLILNFGWSILKSKDSWINGRIIKNESDLFTQF